jgi:hypothetical protein
MSYKVGSSRIYSRRNRPRFPGRIRLGRPRNPRRERVIEIDKEIRSAKTVEAVNSFQNILNNERGFLGEDAYRKLSLLAAKRMNKVGTKKKSIKLGPAGDLGLESKGKLL